MCYKCKKGYFLNESNLCDKVYDSKVCKEIGNLKPSGNSPYDYLNDNPFKMGCISCKNTMYAVSFSFKPEICINNTSASFSSTTSNTFKINNCSIFIFENNLLKCYKCDEGYYLTYDNLSCLLGSIENCLIYLNKE